MIPEDPTNENVKEALDEVTTPAVGLTYRVWLEGTYYVTVQRIESKGWGKPLSRVVFAIANQGWEDVPLWRWQRMVLEGNISECAWSRL